jgi:hypothetical protein
MACWKNIIPFNLIEFNQFHPTYRFFFPLNLPIWRGFYLAMFTEVNSMPRTLQKQRSDLVGTWGALVVSTIVFWTFIP